MKLEVNNVYFRYDTENKSVLSDVSFTIDKPEWITILGHNGSGKSTLSKLLIGIISPTKGSILVDGVEVKEENLYEIRKKIGIVFQNPENQFVSTCVEDDIAFGLECLEVPQEEMDPIIDSCLEQVGMSGFRKRAPSDLSGGQKQRIAIADLLAINPELFILDEATSMLDPKGRKNFIDVVKKLKEQGKTILMITHNMDEAILSDRCIVLNQGKIVKDGPTLEVLNDYDTLKGTRLEMPSELYLYHKLKENNYSNEEVLTALWESASKK